MNQRELIRPDATIRYWTSGPDTSPTLVLLHGATLDHGAWDRQVDALNSSYRLVVPDLRGHGASTGPAQFTFEDAVGDIVALLGHLDLERIGLVGLTSAATSPRRSSTATPAGSPPWSSPTPPATPPRATRCKPR